MTPPEALPPCPTPALRRERRRYPDGCHLAEDASRDAADAAVRKTFAILGVDIDDPESVAALQADLRFGRAMREAAGDLGQDIRRTATRAVLAGLVVLIGYGAVEWVRRALAH